MPSCANKYRGEICKNQASCKEEGTEKCFRAFPPRMTDYQYAEAQTELLKDIPEEFRGTLSAMAWDHGHSAGYEEVINVLRELVSDLTPAINAFEARIHNEYMQK